MNIIEKMKSVLEEYPKIGTLHIDYNLNAADSFGLYPTGDRKVSEDVIGGQERQHTFILYAVFQSFNDYDRLTNSGLLLDLQLWLEQYADNQELTTVINDVTRSGYLKNITCANGLLYNIPDTNLNTAVQYQMQI
ncbi:MAG: hypothetical protein II514_06275, partial [Ruminococcus sp.]|nr:hypothetical protein [Ruminococcus sp.]